MAPTTDASRKDPSCVVAGCPVPGTGSSAFVFAVSTAVLAPDPGPTGRSLSSSAGVPGRTGAGPGRGCVPVIRSVTGSRTGSSTGTLSVTGGTTVSTTAEVAPSAIRTTGVVTAETVPGGTTSRTTGREPRRSSATPATEPATGCSSPAGWAPAVEGTPGTAPSTFSETEWTELVTPPNRDEVSERVSADAGVEENVSQVSVAAPARRTGRRARHGERDLAMRTPPVQF